MIHRFRTLVFFLFVAAFFITAGSVVFYAFGYRFSFERGIFIYTGSLSIKTNVQTVSIKIDDVPIPEKRMGLLNNSIHIAGLNPGEHMIEVGAPGYHSWEKKVVIQSGLTTEFWNILLIQENYEQVIIPETEQVIKIFPAPNGLFATVKKNDDRFRVDILDVGAKLNEEVFSTNDALFLPTLKTNIEWSPESHKLIIPLTKNEEPLYAIVDIKTKEVIYLNEVVHISTPLRAPRWDATTKNYLFFLNQDTLYRYDTSSASSIEKNTPAELIAEHVAAYDISGSNLYYLSTINGIVYQVNGNGSATTPKQITPTPIGLNEGNTYSLITYDETRLSVIEEETGTLFVYNKRVTDVPLKEIGRSIKSIQYSDDGKKLLFYTDNEISVYFNEDWQAQPMRVQDSIIQIVRFSTAIKNIQWSEDYEHVIFSLGKSIKMVELDHRDRRSLSDLMTLDVLPVQILSRFGNNTLYIVRDISSQAPDENALISIVLLQFTTLFGL